MNNKKGFCLLELIVAILILMTLFFLSQGGLGQVIDLLHVRSVAQKLALNLHYLRNNALALSQDGICYFFNNRYVLKLKRYDGNEDVLREVKMPSDVHISGAKKVGFKSNGHSSFSGTVILKTKRGYEKKVMVAVATGRIRIE